MINIESKIKQLKTELINATSLKQTCKIYITTVDSNNISFYFKQGYLVWASSSVHRFRRLYRVLEETCSEVNFQESQLREQEISELWEYLLLKVLNKRRQITLKQLQQAIQQIISEVLFDCIIDSDRIEEIKVISQNKPDHMAIILESRLLKHPMVRVDYEELIEHLEPMVADWTAKLPEYLPNYAPVIVDMDKLTESIDSDAYYQLFIYINGRKTFRDLAILSQQDLTQVARFMAPHIANKLIEVQKVEDLQIANLYFTPPDPTHQTQARHYFKESYLPLIVYIDGNASSCQQAIKILNFAGYQIIAVDNATKASIVLLKNRPNLIIINANTIDFNEYELCSQIKRISKLKNIPIVVARDREQMLDRVKAKIAGISEFIAEPIQAEELLMIAQKYTQTFSNV